MTVFRGLTIFNIYTYVCARAYIHDFYLYRYLFNCFPSNPQTILSRLAFDNVLKYHLLAFSFSTGLIEDLQ